MRRRCPVCRKPVGTPSEGGSTDMRFFPFCCERCKLIDLGAWLDAEYRIASEPRPDEGPGSSAGSDGD